MTIEHFLDYGPMMSCEHGDTKVLASRTFWSFYKVPDHPWICLMRMDEWDEKGVFLGTSYQTSYTSCYSHSEDFYSWWDKTFEFSKQDHALGYPDYKLCDDLVNHYKAYLNTIT
jgi:hypothetical protein